MDKQPMTIRGKEMLEKELSHLMKVERPDVIKAIEEARSHGDLSENADYDAAKERQGFVEARINEIQGKLAVANVVDPSKIKSDKIVFGATVVILDTETEGEYKYTIVGEDEADVKNGLLSIFSPMARAMIGKKEGDAFEINTPKGVKEYEIVEFSFK